MSQPWRDPDESVEKAHECYEAGRWREAEELLRQALAQQPDRAEWHFNLGMTLEAAEKYGAAAEAFADAARHSSPEEPTPWIACAVNHLRDNKPSKAVRPLERARRLDPDRADAFVHSIEAYSRTGRHEDAEEMFYRALQLEGHHADAYANMGEAMIERVAESEKEHNEKAVRAGYERAAACFRESLKIAAAENSDNPRAGGPSRVASRLAYCLQRLGKLDEARRWYLRELRENPGDVETLFDLGECLVESGRLPDAAEKFRRILELKPDHVDAHFALGTVAMRRQRHRSAARRFSKVLRLDPTHDEARLCLARALMALGDRARARAVLGREVSLLRRHKAERSSAGGAAAPGWPASRLAELGTMLLELEMPRRAVYVLSQLVRSARTDARAVHHLGVALLQIGKVRRGVAAERRAVRLDPGIVEAWHNLALAAIRERRWVRARAWIARARALAPGDPNIRRLVALYRVERLLAPLRVLWRGRG